MRSSRPSTRSPRRALEAPRADSYGRVRRERAEALCYDSSVLVIERRVIAAGLVLSAVLAMATGACGDGKGGSSAGGSASCSEDPCKLTLPQCGCDEDQRCTVDGLGTRFCDKTGSARLGEECAAGDGDCGAGAICVGLSATLHACAAFCEADTDCAVGGLCIRHLSDGNGGALPGVALCTEACDPAALTGCAASGTSCALLHETDGAQRWYTQCVVPTSTSHDGDACDATPCGPGLVCVDLDSVKTCRALCVVGGGGCEAPTQCTAFQNAVTVGSVEYGSCK